MKVWIFLSDYDDNRHITSGDPVQRSVQEALDEFQNLSNSPGCFFGMIDEESNTIQFMWNSDNSIQIDVPVAARQGSYSKRATFEECCGIIASFGTGIRIALIPGLEFEEW